MRMASFAGPGAISFADDRPNNLVVWTEGEGLQLGHVGTAVLKSHFRRVIPFECFPHERHVAYMVGSGPKAALMPSLYSDARLPEK